MKTKEQIQAALDEIKAVCDKHGVVLMGTDLNEGVFGEILISPSNSVKWAFPERQSWNSISSYGREGFFVEAIGTLKAKE